MENKDLRKIAFDHALSLPGVEEHPFHPDWVAVRVAGKWFLNATVLDGKQLINVKADPSDVTALVESHPSIERGYHMNKTHWATITPGDDITADLVKELVTDSYALVVASLPKAKRPYLAAKYLDR